MALGVVLALLAFVGTAAAADLVPVAPVPLDQRRSGYAEMGAATRAMQSDDGLNPAMLWVARGRQSWSAAPEGGVPSCAGCHGPLDQAMAGVAARHPAIHAASGRAIDLAGRIDVCRVERQGRPSAPPDDPEMVALAAAIGLRSRGMPVTPDPDPRMDPVRAEGERLYHTRMGQLDLACAQCHDALWGRRLAGNAIPQAYALGYPTYRLEWQGVGSLQRRLRNCMTGVRAEPFTPGVPEMIAIEAYLAARAAGMAVETPAVRP
jgi:sulfur-oxidizing protein SoxA